MALDVTTGPVFQSGKPHSLFQTDIVDTVHPSQWS